MLSADQLRLDLAQFHGSGSFVRHWTGRLVYTEGVEHLAENAGAHWLIDAIASYQSARLRFHPRLRDFQLWELRVHDDDRATLACRADSGEPAFITQHIEYTDFPLDAIKLYVENETLMLPGER